MLTLLCVSADRFRRFRLPGLSDSEDEDEDSSVAPREPVEPGVASAPPARPIYVISAVWAIAVGVTLPYTKYITYIDLSVRSVQ